MSSNSRTSSALETALVFVHNHRFEQNLDTLDRIYADRFTNLRHLVPFYQGSRPNVVPVHESSHHFQGFFAQACAELEALSCDYYLFCGDDVFINPGLTAKNIATSLHLAPDAAYIKSIDAAVDLSLAWRHLAGALVVFAHNSGVEWQKELPPRSEATARFTKHELVANSLKWNSFRRGVRPKQALQLTYYLLQRLRRGRHALPLEALLYPLAAGYSDFVVVPRGALRAFCSYCGVFAAMDLFAEIAIPTALVLACDYIVQESAIGQKGLELWSEAEVSAVQRRYRGKLALLVDQFPADRLYVHPVKLSRWSS